LAPLDDLNATAVHRAFAWILTHVVVRGKPTLYYELKLKIMTLFLVCFVFRFV